MDRNINVEKTLHKAVYGDTEIVERKGIGHPDSLCDGIAEQISVALCKHYQKETGTILHHNTDKVLLNAGQAEVRFGYGKITKPIHIVLSGNATFKTDQHEIDVPHVATKTTKEYLNNVLRYLDVKNDVEIDCRIASGSVDLAEIYKRKGKKSSNDTSFGCGYAPLSPLEQKVLSIERHLNSKEFKQRVPASGEDVKVMGLRKNNRLRVTIAAAVVGSQVAHLEAYQDVMARVKEEAHKIAGDGDTEIVVNTGDDYEKQSVFITATGTSAEHGDPGEVGRGNRVNGLITPFKPMSLEAAAGKNPVTHIGKIYNIASMLLANQIVKENTEVEFCEVYLLSQIGSPVDQPKAADVQIRTKLEGAEYDTLKKRIGDLVDHHLETIEETTTLIINQKVSVF
ncbi:methionine adenosyltransferase [Candidatus Micrarchaeota archaeon]|nr:methionine adenosyltransferase [Candidatus Micrarchaeota archaeon]